MRRIVTTQVSTQRVVSVLSPKPQPGSSRTRPPSAAVISR